MKKFHYRARSQQGKLMTGLVEAVDEKQAVALLRSKGLVVVSLQAGGGLSEWLLNLIHRVGLGEMANFTRQLSTMIAAGLSLVQALIILENQFEGNFKTVIADVRRGVESGKSLSKSLTEAGGGKVFDKVYVSMVKSGESAGVLDQVMSRLADTIEAKRDFQSKLKGALLYPIIIFIAMIVVMVVMMFFVIPQLGDLYAEFEADLPWMTKLLISTSNFAVSYWWLMVIVIVGLVIAGKVMYQNPETRVSLEKLWLSAPVFGIMREEILMANMTRTLAMLSAAGVPIVEALQLTSQGLGSLLYERGVVKATQLVEKGIPLAQAFAQQSQFPQVLPQMMVVGEETGQIDKVMIKISTYFQAESEQRVKNLTTALEPIILMILGAGVGFLVFAVVMPIYNLTNAL